VFSDISQKFGADSQGGEGSDRPLAIKCYGFSINKRLLTGRPFTTNTSTTGMLRRMDSTELYIVTLNEITSFQLYYNDKIDVVFLSDRLTASLHIAAAMLLPPKVIPCQSIADMDGNAALKRLRLEVTTAAAVVNT